MKTKQFYLNTDSSLEINYITDLKLEQKQFWEIVNQLDKQIADQNDTIERYGKPEFPLIKTEIVEKKEHYTVTTFCYSTNCNRTTLTMYVCDEGYHFN